MIYSVASALTIIGYIHLFSSELPVEDAFFITIFKSISLEHCITEENATKFHEGLNSQFDEEAKT